MLICGRQKSSFDIGFPIGTALHITRLAKQAVDGLTVGARDDRAAKAGLTVARISGQTTTTIVGKHIPA